METALIIIGTVSTALFAVRLIMMFIGVDGHDGDVMHAPESASAADVADFKIFTLLTGIVTLMVGSWTALLFDSLQWPIWISLGAGYAIGFAAAVATGYALFSMRRLESDGTIRDFEASGLKGTCYVSIPEAGQGKGQVQITVQGRLRTFDAVSDGPAIESFKPIVVMSRIDNNTLRVCQTE